MNRKVMKATTCCFASAVALAATPFSVNAAATAGISNSISVEAATEAATGQSAQAGASIVISNCLSNGAADQSTDNHTDNAAQNTVIAEEKDTKKKEEEKKEKKNTEYDNMVIAQVNDYVNVRGAADENGEILGKLPNNAAATVVGEEGDWYQIQSGSVEGYVSRQYVVQADEELAESVGRKVATVNADALRVRTEANTDSDILSTVASGEELQVVDDGQNDWVQVSVDGNEGYVSEEYVDTKVVFDQAESKEEEAARIAQEQAEAAVTLGEDTDASAMAAAPASSMGQAVADYACQFIGNPYVWGGTSLTNGADCSGFVLAVYAHFGVSLPHSSGAQAGVGYGVSRDQIQPGDIVCYSGHVGIYVGNNTIVNASTEATGIKYTSPIDYRPIVAIRRIF